MTLCGGGGDAYRLTGNKTEGPACKTNGEGGDNIKQGFK
jgi:hypothetical protein